MQCTAERPSGNRAEPDPDPYRPIRYPDPTTEGIRVRHTAAARMAAQEWVQSHVAQIISHPTDAAEAGMKAAAIAWELMDNAHKHSRSGVPGETLDLELLRSKFLLTVAVTDAGPLSLFDPSCPLPQQLDGRGGLHRVAEIAFYWGWKGGAGYPVTVHAKIELPDQATGALLP